MNEASASLEAAARADETGTARIVVVGIGAGGWAELGESARAAIASASLLVGGERHLELVPDTGAERRAWPSPIGGLVDELVAMRGGPVCVLSSGDPMLHGIGATLARRVGLERLDVFPHPSARALVCARLGWPEAETELVSAVARPPEVIAPALAPGHRLVVYSTGVDGASAVARVAGERGYGPSRMAVLEELGGAAERIVESTVEGWGERKVAPLHAVALECRAAPDAPLLTRTPGLPDEAYDGDTQMTKREVRAVTLAALRPVPGQLLWDVGAGSGTVSIEWMRTHPGCQAIAIEARAERAERIAANAVRLGVPALEVVTGTAPEALAGLDRPDAIFVGGGVAVPGLLDDCLDALRAGGRLVANAVTLEGEGVLARARGRHGGSLVRLQTSYAEPLGGFSGWRPARPVTQWELRRGQ